MKHPSHTPAGPDFVGIGVQKSGTTWVADMLSQHPQIFLPKKEISFFVQNFHRGYAWYNRIFEQKGQRRAGELTVSYMITPRSSPVRKEFYPKWNPRRKIFFWRKQPPARDALKANYPGVKIFAVFRNPVDRTWSHYWYWRSRKEHLNKNVVQFEKMFADDGRWIHTYSRYADLLRYWRQAFPDMGVFFYDDLRQEPEAFLYELFRFLDIDPDFKPRLNQEVNKGDYEAMPEHIRKLLVRAYREQIEEFARQTGRDLSHWIQG